MIIFYVNTNIVVNITKVTSAIIIVINITKVISAIIIINNNIFDAVQNFIAKKVLSWRCTHHQHHPKYSYQNGQ